MRSEIKVYVLSRNRPSLYLRYIDPVTGKPVEKSAQTADRTEAHKAAGVWEDELRQGRYKPAPRVTWDEFRDRYEDEVLAGLADSTAKKVAAVFNAVESYIDPCRLSSLGAEEISALQAKYREKKRSENTIKSHMAHLKSALRWANRMGMLREVPNIEMPRRTKTARHRAVTREEFERMLQAIPKAVGKERAASWRHFLIGLWWSGLRIAESLNLTWDQDNSLMIDTTGRRVMLWIPAERQKNHKNEVLPLAPEFAEFLLATPDGERTGFVFNPKGRFVKEPRRLTDQQAIRTICAIGVKAGVKVGTNERTGEPQYASAHDFRRSFGDRWSKRVMPAVLKQLMRHSSIATTMQYYVTGDVQATADLLYETVKGDTFGDFSQIAEAEDRNENTEVIQTE